FVEIYQNCNVFNDGAVDLLREKAAGAQRNQIRLRHGEPTVFGAEGEFCVVAQADGSMSIRDTADTPPEHVYVHDAHPPTPSPAPAMPVAASASWGTVEHRIPRSSSVMSSVSESTPGAAHVTMWGTRWVAWPSTAIPAAASPSRIRPVILHRRAARSGTSGLP